MQCASGSTSPRIWMIALLCTFVATQVAAQANSTANDSQGDLREQVRNLQEAVSEIRAESARYRQETEELRHELELTRSQIATASDSAESVTTAINDTTPQSKLDKLDDQYSLLAGKVDDQYQTKVESWSKYRVRLSGIVLFNLFSNGGTVDNADIPALAFPNPPGSSGGDFGATLRQSQIGLEAVGPRFLGARTSANLLFDFGGGFANLPNGVNYGLSWLRTGTVRLDWTNTSIVAGQDALFFSPAGPTSFASLSVPALNYAGNLWSWTPQVRVEHRFAVRENSQVLVQAGLLDSLDGETPASGNYRAPQAGEYSRQPAYAGRLAWDRPLFGQTLTVGGGGYFGRQDYGFGRIVEGWAVTTDWNLPLSTRFSLSGKFYRGLAVGGIGGGLGSSVIANGDPTIQATRIRGLDSAGGWAQLKYKLRPTVEFNAAYGEDNPFAADVQNYGGANSGPSLLRNQGSLANVIYRPRSDLILSAEYHYLKTFATGRQIYTANQLNLLMGVLF